MEFTRRTALKMASLAGTALFLPPGLLEAAGPTSAELGADGRPIRAPRFPITRSLLSGYVGSDFYASTLGGNQVTLRLVVVDDLPNAAIAGLEGSENSFAARFQDSSGHLLSQGTYRLNHLQLGRIWFFLVPVGQPSAEAQTYEAVFNNAPTPPTRPRRGR